MSAQNAKDAADNFVALLRLPPKPATQGTKYQLVTFASEEDCRFFYPRRALNWQLQFNTYISRALRERHGIRVQRIALARTDYVTWRQRCKIVLDDTAELRRTFADKHLIVVIQ